MLPMTRTSWQPDVVSLRLFVAVCEEATIARAADRQAISPSAISKRIAEIEERVGVELLVRGGRGVRPTPAGMALLHHARQVLRSLDKLQSELGEYAHGVRGHVRVFANVSAIVEFLPDDVTSFLTQYTDVRIDLQERFSSAVVEAVRNRVADIGIYWGIVDASGLKVLPYETDDLVVAVPAKHPLAEAKSIAFHETLVFDHVELQPETQMHAFLSGMAAHAGKKLIERVHVATFETACRVIGAGLGIGVVPSPVMRTYGPTFGLRSIPLSDSWAHREIMICMRDYDALLVPARAFVDHLVRRSAARRTGSR